MGCRRQPGALYGRQASSYGRPKATCQATRQAPLGILAGLGSLRLMRLPRAKTMSCAGGEGHTTPENVENKKM